MFWIPLFSRAVEAGRSLRTRLVTAICIRRVKTYVVSNGTLPATMRAAVMYDVDDIRIEERPLPVLEPGDVLVRTAASGVCSGDLMPWYVRKKAPFVFGHEPSGTVVAFGGDVPQTLRAGRTLALGDRVFAHHHAPCLNCDACRAGHHVHCATWRATSLDPGGMAEFFRVPRANLVDTLLLPDKLSFADGSLIEPLACVVKSLRRAFPNEFGRSTGDAASSAPFVSDDEIVAESPAQGAAGPCLAGRTLYVIGAGVMGQMHVAVAAGFGATVYASDFHSGRRALAESLGAAAAFDPATAIASLGAASSGRLAHATICGPGTPAALEHAVAATGADGTVVMFTPIDPESRFEFDQSAAYFRDIRLVSSYSCGPNDTADALRLIAGGVVTAQKLGAAEFPFPGVASAYDQMSRARVVKAIVTFSQTGTPHTAGTALSKPTASYARPEACAESPPVPT